MTAVDYKQVQGLLRFGYGRLTEASFMLLTIRDPDAARAWLASAPTSNAVTCTDAPKTALQIAFTRQGLDRIGVPPQIVSGFSAEFLGGMSADPSRSLLLGDTGANAPQNWQWGASGNIPDLLVLLYAQPGALHNWTVTVQGPHWADAFEVLACLPTSNLGGFEPFGFADGVSQPTLDWDRSLSTAHEQIAFNNTINLGEFVLGYPNEYSRYTGRPLVSPEDSKAAVLPIAEDAPPQRDFGANGSYLVLRTLEQDVGGFWRFLNDQAAYNPDTREYLAAVMVGRHRDGTPLVPLAPDPISGIAPASAAQNNFTFDSDTSGIRCPFGAHIRRANPRSADLPTPVAPLLLRTLGRVGLAPKGSGVDALRGDAKASARFHRLLRRGREYGSALPADEAIAQPTHAATDSTVSPRGIHFIALVANIARQFEFIQGAWLMASKFDAMTDEADPLLGNRARISGNGPSDAFSLPREDGLRDRIDGLPQFITVKGGAYFFLPSLAALRYISNCV